MNSIRIAGANSPHMAKAKTLQEVKVGSALGFISDDPITIEHEVSKAEPVREAHASIKLEPGFYLTSIAQELNIATGNPQNDFD
jgi:hypothetical protein